MKKIFNLCSGVIIAFFFISFFGCEKAENVSTDSISFSEITPKTQGSSTGIVIRSGHPGKDCPGCIRWWGKLIHIDCLGLGKDCEVPLWGTLEPISATYYSYTIQEGGSFLMDGLDEIDISSQSYCLPNTNPSVWINIPEQSMSTDLDGLFVIQDITLSSVPSYDFE